MTISKIIFKASGSGGDSGGGRSGAGSSSHCSLYRAVTDKIDRLKQHFLLLATP